MCNRLCLLLRSAMATIDTLIGVRGSYLREYSGINSIVCKVVLNIKLFLFFSWFTMSPYRTQLNKTGIPGQVHTASVASLSSLKFFFSSHSRKHTGRLPELTSATINSPSHSYLIMTKHCNSPGSTHGTLTGYTAQVADVVLMINRKARICYS